MAPDELSGFGSTWTNKVLTIGNSVFDLHSYISKFESSLVFGVNILYAASVIFFCVWWKRENSLERLTIGLRRVFDGDFKTDKIKG